MQSCPVSFPSFPCLATLVKFRLPWTCPKQFSIAPSFVRGKNRTLLSLSFTQKKMWFSFLKVSAEQCAAQHPSVLNVLLYFSKLAVTSGILTAQWILSDANLIKLLIKRVNKISFVMDQKQIRLILQQKLVQNRNNMVIEG